MTYHVTTCFSGRAPGGHSAGRGFDSPFLPFFPFLFDFLNKHPASTAPYAPIYTDTTLSLCARSNTLPKASNTPSISLPTTQRDEDRTPQDVVI